MEKVHVEVGAEPVAHDAADAAGLLNTVRGIAITGVDPGQVLAVSGATARGEHWRREQAGEFVSDPAGEDVHAFEVTGETYRTWALSLRNEQGEADRRNANPEYAEAIAALAAEHTRTGDIEVSCGAQTVRSVVACGKALYFVFSTCHCTQHADAMYGDLLQLCVCNIVRSALFSAIATHVHRRCTALRFVNARCPCRC
jgi:hypothetical protein